jgi:hypothetical protein
MFDLIPKLEQKDMAVMKPISLKAINSRLHHHLKEALDGKRCL